MATFKSTVERLTISEHPNADALELAQVGDYNVIVPKNVYQTGDLAVYIPEFAIVPDWMITELGLEGKLAGSNKNRVKTIKLRGVLSEGLVYPTKGGVLSNLDTGESKLVVEGDDVTEFLGIVKWEPPIPVHMSGQVFNALGKTVKYDIESYKKYNRVLEEGEDVVITEKIHGTQACLGYHPEVGPVVASKGLSAQGVALKVNEENKGNVYVRHSEDVLQRGTRYFGTDVPFYIFGEIFGKGVQDLHYGTQQTEFRVFDIYVGEPQKGRFLDFNYLKSAVQDMGLQMVPVLYRGPFSREKLYDLTDGQESVSGTNANIREGVVVKPTTERYSDKVGGRVILKNISEHYKLRKGDKTEYN